jgi:peptidoglycan/LPS O-acetylase OafA/YrhL
MAPPTRLPARNLDVLRAVAVLSVWLGHVIQTVRHQIGDAGLGRIGVLAFFVHTSLVLMASIERAGVAPGWVRTFYFRRAARIYPLVWVTIALCVVGNLPYSTIAPNGGEQVARSVAHSTRAVAANAFLVQNLVSNAENVIGPLWTLPLEMQMYLLLPVGFLLATRSRRAALVGLLAAMLAAAGVTWLPVRGLWRLGVLGFAPCFAAGVLAFAMLRRHPTPRAHSFLWFGILALLWTIGLSVPVTMPVVGWAFCLVLGVSVATIPELPTSLVTRGSEVIAKYSYGIYLLHMPAWSIAFEWVNAPAAVQWAVYLILLVGLPVVAYHFIEAPAIRWARGPKPVGAPVLAKQAA